MSGTRVQPERATELADELEEIKAQMLDLLQEAEGLLRGTGVILDRARSYWLAHIRTALDDDHDYLGGSMHTMQDSIDELMGDENEEE